MPADRIADALGHERGDLLAEARIHLTAPRHLHVHNKVEGEAFGRLVHHLARDADSDRDSAIFDGTRRLDARVVAYVGKDGHATLEPQANAKGGERRLGLLHLGHTASHTRRHHLLLEELFIRLGIVGSHLIHHLPKGVGSLHHPRRHLDVLQHRRQLHHASFRSGRCGCWKCLRASLDE